MLCQLSYVGVTNASVDKKKLNSTSHPARYKKRQQEVLSLCPLRRYVWPRQLPRAIKLGYSIDFADAVNLLLKKNSALFGGSTESFLDPDGVNKMPQDKN